MSKEIILYSGPKCPVCKRLKAWLKRHKIPFVEKSIEDTEVMADLVMRNVHLLSAPALEINGVVFIRY